MKSAEIRQKFLKFFESKGHKIIPSASLIPENDPSVLFTTAGMQQFKPYYIGKKNAKEDFGTLNVTSVQKCIRTSDIDEVGDESHLTFFEMLGNFSFGGYWKEDAIKYAHEFITSPGWMNLKIDYISVFTGEGNVPADLESEKIWKSIDSNIVVKKSGRSDNFWGPTGEEGPCGPTTEIYVDGIEIWNIVFNEFYQNSDKTLKPLETKGVDTGMGLERLTKVVQKVPTVFDTDLFASLFDLIGGNVSEKNKRIILDHIKASSFMICDGIIPGNKGADYVLRRIMRRILAMDPTLNIYTIVDKISEMYETLDKNKIHSVFKEEREKFDKTLARGLIEMEKIEDINAISAFKLYESYGLPFEVIKDKFPKLSREDFEKEFEKHQEVSKAGMEQKFKGGLGGHSEMEIKYHTATHLLRQALEEVLGEVIMQKGSNITTERLRFDFGFGRKMTDEEKKKVEDLVNQKISENLPVNKVVMKKEEAEKTGAVHMFGEKYGDEVSIYYIGDSLESAWSKEFCGGPHVSRTGELGHFKITKEEASSAGVRRIKAILE
jgi:alanyl-tRNA synthetase